MKMASSAARLGASCSAMISASSARSRAPARPTVCAVLLTWLSRTNVGLNAAASASGVNQSFIHSPLKLQIRRVGIAF
jgi:hypothetical protein